jgi:hypothetical protein
MARTFTESLMTKRPSLQMRSNWLLAVTLLVVSSSCDRQITVYVDVPGDSSGSGGSSGSSGVGGSSAGPSDAGSHGGGAGGTAGTNDDAGSANDLGEADAACSTDVDCPPPDRTCAVSRCRAGRCEVVDVPAGAMVPNVPADCHASLCDGSGHATSAVVDRTNVPRSDGPCSVAACNVSGDRETAALPAGTACRAGPRTAMCDGAGSCVECNHTTDCAPGLFCDAHHFCGSAACTDLECGGACAPCGQGKRCLVDSDCRSFACDAATTTCIASQCLDHRQDGDETDADCGGGTCAGCALGQSCLLDEDCKSRACDVLTLKCVSNQCADHRLDGPETDIDCGGPVCGSCAVSQKCGSSLDCQSGHICNASKVCQ